MGKNNAKRFVKTIIDGLWDNFTLVAELISLIVLFWLPVVFDARALFSRFIEENYPDPSNFVYYLALQQNNYLIGILLVVIFWVIFRRSNAEKYVMNRKNIYHQSPYVWYWFCAKVLAVTKCNLVLVPIHMQIKLIVRDTFKEYPWDEKSYPIEAETKINEQRVNFSKGKNYDTFNIVIEDTYPIEFKQMPQGIRDLPTIRIKRENGNDSNRYYSIKLIEKVKNIVNDLPEESSINLFTTLNPVNCYYISRNILKTADRGKIRRLYVFQQDNTGIRTFSRKKKRVY